MPSISTEDNNKPITVTAGAAITKGQLLTLSGSTASVAGLTSEPEAVALEDITSGEIGAAKRLAYNDTFEVLADDSVITAGAVVYGAADGEASDTQGVGAFRVGNAVTAAGDGELFEMAYKPGFTAGT